MRKTFDRRVVRDSVLDFVRACQVRIPCHLGGGAALAGVYLGHRTTGDIDLFVHDAEDMRALVGLLPAAAAEAGVDITLLRDVGHLVRAQLAAQDGSGVEVDVVHEPVADIAAPPPPIEGVVVESLTDLRASKLTCILSLRAARSRRPLFPRPGRIPPRARSRSRPAQGRRNRSRSACLAPRPVSDSSPAHDARAAH